MAKSKSRHTDGNKSFRRQKFIKRDELLGSRWWHEDMAAPHAQETGSTRREWLRSFLVVGGLVCVGMARAACNDCGSGDSVIAMDALDLQKREGWAVGADGDSLSLTGTSQLDSLNDTTWMGTLPSLATDLAPAQARLQPFYVPTLFEVLRDQRSDVLRRILRPLHTGSMDRAYDAGLALAGLFHDEPAPSSADAGAPSSGRTALCIDMPGPESVACAAATANVFEPVFLYDNWPHPRGVVPSHEVLAAALYYRAELRLRATTRRFDSAPAFVLDSRRLNPYRDESDRFDNRYLARLPSADALTGFGITRLLYVTETPQEHEMDDLNDDFVALKDKGIDVKMIALSEFQPAAPALAQTSDNTHTYYYGGHPSGYFFFWSNYGWRASTTRSVPTSLPRPASPGARFVPTSRPTIFSSRTVGGLSGVGRQRPSGFGRVSYRSGSSSSGRSGSFGRSSGGFG